MKKQTTKSNSGALSRIIKATFTPGLLSALVLLFSIQASRAGSATWNLNPTGHPSWDTATNWTPATVPNGPADTATFDVSNTTDVFVDGGNLEVIEVNGIVFNAGASAFTIAVENFSSFDDVLVISGVGITNNSGITQNFVTDTVGGDSQAILFTNSATAGNLTIFTNSYGSPIDFFGTSSAGSGTFINNDGAFGGTNFFDSATADNAALIANDLPGFFEGGLILFSGDSTGGTARVEVFGNGSLNISAHNTPGVTVGSIEGDGLVFVGANNLAVGSNNLSTTFDGVIDGFGGSLTKIGTGTLTLAKANTYTGGTTIEGGRLWLNNMSGSGTGSGGVQVNAGTLGGRGFITGAVTVGTGSGAGAVLAPRRKGGRPLTIQNTLTFKFDATYEVGLNSDHAVADKVVARGVRIRGAQIAFDDSASGVLPPGTAFTLIDNMATSPLSGTFSNLPDNSTVTVGNNTFQADYQGGDGNDLTLTVVP